MKLGLSLSGGGIKGVCHIGAIKALEEANIKFDYISGTSSGRIVATLYPCGFTTDEIYDKFKKYAKELKANDVNVLIHDGVRPLITQQTITDNINMVNDKGNCITCIPATETFIVTQDDGSLDIPSREHSKIARAPQSFRLNDILQAHKKVLERNRHDYIDSCTLMSSMGYKMNTIMGPMENIKITTPTDYFIFRAMVEVHENQQIFGF